MRTAAQSKADRKELHRSIAQQHRAEARAKLAALRTAVKEARKKRSESHAFARTQCKLARAIVRQRAKEHRERALSDLRRAREEERAAAHSSCQILKDEARASKEGHAQARAVHAAERQYRRELRTIEANNRKKLKAHRATSAKERRAESDDEVRANLDPSMLALFERVKRSIKATPRMTRTEVFLQYAHENPGELLGALDDDAERQIRELERQRDEAHKQARRVPSLRTRMRRKKYTAAELAETPF